MRRVVCHYHIFKNGGTTVQYALKRSFGAGYREIDSADPDASLGPEDLAAFLLANPGVRALSSHQIRLPVPRDEALDVVACLLLRHPLLRIASIYRWYGATRLKHAVKRRLRLTGATEERLRALADRSRSLAGWLETVLSRPGDVHYLSNAQARFCSGREDGAAAPLDAPRADGGLSFDLGRARANLGAVVLLGRTESLDADLPRFQERVAGLGIEVDFVSSRARNVTDPDFSEPLSRRLDGLRQDIGPGLYARLESLNDQDLELWDRAGRG